MVQVAPVSQQIWDMKYRLKAVDGSPVDKAIPDTWRRVARALAEAEADPSAWEEPFFDAMTDFSSCLPVASFPAPAPAAVSPYSTASSWATSRTT